VTTQGSGAVWAIETIDDPIFFCCMGDRSLTLDSTDHPHVVYGGDHLYYAWRDDFIWQYQVVDPSPNVGSYASIELDSGDHPHISYHDSANEDLKYAHETGSDWWAIESIVYRGGLVGSDTSLALDSDNHPHISYSDSTYYDLKYARWTGSAWVNEIVDSDGNVGWHTSLA
jgi:hypothetical protein